MEPEPPDPVDLVPSASTDLARALDQVGELVEDDRTDDDVRREAWRGIAVSVLVAAVAVAWSWWTGEWYLTAITVPVCGVMIAQSTASLRTGHGPLWIDPHEFATRILDADWPEPPTAPDPEGLLVARTRIQELRDRLDAGVAWWGTTVERALTWTSGVFGVVWVVMALVSLGFGMPVWLAPMFLVNAVLFGWLARRSHGRAAARDDATALLDDLLERLAIRGPDDP